MIEAKEITLASADPAVAAMVCGAADPLWTGLERALDNGRGFVFVTDAAGLLKGYADLAAMREAFMKGGHLSGVTVGDVAAPGAVRKSRSASRLFWMAKAVFWASTSPGRSHSCRCRNRT